MSDLILIALFDGSWLGQTFEWNDLIVVGMLILLEGVLSIDNALVLGLLAKRLPAHQRSRALSYGLIGAFVFRVLAILLAGFLLQWTIAKLLGGGYLIYIALKHLLFEGHEDESDRVVLDSQGHPILVDAATGQELSPEREDLEIEERVPIGSSLVIDHADTHASAAPKTNGSTSPFKTSRAPAVFWRTVLVIELTDIAFAVDSILAAMALAGSRSSKLWVVIAGGIIGLVLMRFAAVVFIRLLDRFPRFETSAYLLVVVIGLKLVLDWGCNSDWSFQQTPWLQKQLGSWQQPLSEFETRRRDWADNYHVWLEQNWPLGVAANPHNPASETEHNNVEPSSDQTPAVSNDNNAMTLGRVPAYVPHLIDFHDMRRPESLTFWAAMAACFGFGFMPKRSSPSSQK